MKQRYLFFLLLFCNVLLAQAPLPPNIRLTPPTAPVRCMAEWEELQALLISWTTNTSRDYRPLLTEIVRAAREECRVVICCLNQSIADSAKNYLAGRGVAVDSNVEFVVVPLDSIWIRDYGPNSIYAHDVDSLYFVDWIYNRARFRDDTISRRLSRHFGVPLYATAKAPYDLVNTGGNVVPDGMGMALSSDLVLYENGPSNSFGTSNHDEAAVNALMESFMGIKRYLKMDMLDYDVIHHLDMHLKLIDEQTLLVGQYPPNVSDGPRIEANLQYLISQMSSFGQPFQVVRVPMPPFNNRYPPHSNAPYLYPTYTNSVFVNKTILMPKYEQSLDAVALKTYQEALPGYKVVPIDCRNIVYDAGAIHCITKEVGVVNPLRIVHRQLPPIVQGNNQPAAYPVEALVQHKSGIANATVWYSLDTSATVWQSVPLSQSAHPDSLDYWRGWIPRQQLDNDAFKVVYYYIEAHAQNGKRQVRPMPAPKGWWKFKIVPETISTTETFRVEMLDPYPNPSRSITCIPINLPQRAIGSVKLYNGLGSALHTISEGSLPAGPSNHFLDASKYAPGLYFIGLEVGGQIEMKKLVIR